MATGGTSHWVREVRARAHEVLPPSVWRYVEEGAGDEVTLGEATAAWAGHRFRPHTLRDVREADLGVDLLGHRSLLPLGIAPMTLQRAAHPDGEVAMASAAQRAGVPLVLSSNAGSTFAEVEATGVRWWLQLYVGQDRAASLDLVDRAVADGAGAVVLTVDTPVVATRHRAADLPDVWEEADPAWMGSNLELGGLRPGSRPKAMDLGPADVTALADRSGVPVVVKGVLRGDDAVLAVDAGAAAVWVSNHGGRQLDRAAATAHCLPEVRAAVGEETTVLVDGGVRSALDVAAALGLGADAVFLGRPALHALAAGGPEELVRGLELFTEELTEVLRLAGAASCTGLRGTVSRS